MPLIPVLAAAALANDGPSAQMYAELREDAAVALRLELPPNEWRDPIGMGEPFFLYRGPIHYPVLDDLVLLDELTLRPTDALETYQRCHYTDHHKDDPPQHDCDGDGEDECPVPCAVWGRFEYAEACVPPGQWVYDGVEDLDATIGPGGGVFGRFHPYAEVQVPDVGQGDCGAGDPDTGAAPGTVAACPDGCTTSGPLEGWLVATMTAIGLLALRRRR